VGNVAIDVARSAIRLKNVSQSDIYCLESRTEMPAHHEEVSEALEEDVDIHNGYGPSRILRENNKVIGVEFKRCLSTFDESGSFNPQFDENDLIVVPCDYVLLSVGQTFNYGNLFEGEAVKLTGRNTVDVNPITLQSSQEDIFAGGDVASGPRLAIDAIAAGKEGAVSIHRYVQNGQSLIFGRDNHSYVMFDKDNLDSGIDYDGTERQRIKHVDGKESKTTFKDLRGLLTEEQIQMETERCLSCGATKVDEYLCVGCGACTLRCKFEAISLERVYDEKGFEIENLPKAVLKNVVVRKAKITLNKINPFTERR
jgi:NADPH-dependent glutamate synthase beta subunit-like oxidoreductase